MRHDPASAAVVVMVRGLKMYGMPEAVDELIERGAPPFDTAVPILSQLLKAELAEREVRPIAYHLKGAASPDDETLVACQRRQVDFGPIGALRLPWRAIPML